MTAPLRYEYRAARRDGGIVRGELIADGRDAASAALAAQGLFPIDLVSAPPRPRSALGAADVAIGLRTLATLIETGIPVSRAIAAFAELAPAAWRPWVTPLRERIGQGGSVADALALVPMRSAGTLIGIVRAGERGGQLAPALSRAATLAESTQATRDAVVAALTYPVVLLTAGSISLAILLGVVVPRFALILEDLGQSLPPATRWLIAVTASARTWAPPALFGVAVGGVAIAMWVAGNANALRRVHALLLRIPLIGTARHAFATSRLSGSLAGLLESGLPLSTSLSYAGQAAGDAEVEDRVRRAREHVLAGASLAGALHDERAVTPGALQLIRAGEEAGRSAELLRHASAIEDARGRRIIQMSVRLLEPAIIVAFALLVAFVAAALLQAVYAVRPA